MPAPETGDENKCLRGDGSWATVSGGSGGLIQIGVIPSQANTVTYDGTPQTCNWNDYDPEKLAMDGDYEATEAGDHIVGFTPQGNCIWSDGTQDRKTATFRIDKAARVLSLSANSGSVDLTDKKNFTDITEKFFSDICKKRLLGTQKVFLLTFRYAKSKMQKILKKS